MPKVKSTRQSTAKETTRRSRSTVTERKTTQKNVSNSKALKNIQSNAASSTMMKDTPSIFQFKITLRETRPYIWRRIQIHDDTTFQAFHLAIVNSMGWANSHCHAFQSPDTEFVPSYDLDLDLDDDRKRIDEAKVKLSDYFKNPKDRILHLYDFGDGWEHVIELEKVMPAAAQTNYPVCIDGKRACPPDDCGGVGGFREHCKIMSDPKHPEYEEVKEWLVEIGLKNWKADVFNPKSVKF